MRNKKLIISVMLCIAIVITFTLLASYAYWKVQKRQLEPTKAATACLEIRIDQDVDEEGKLIEGFTLENAWPMYDDDALANLKGYHFTIKNTCAEPLFYEVVLDSLPLEDSNKEIDDKYVVVNVDNANSLNYSQLPKESFESAGYQIKDSKIIAAGVVSGRKENVDGIINHTLRMWVDYYAPNDEIGKNFKSKVRVIAGQGVGYPPTPDYCFNFDSETGTINGENMNYLINDCTFEQLIIPDAINDVKVSDISITAFSTIFHINYLDLSRAKHLKTIGAGAFSTFKGYYLNLGNSLEDIGNFSFKNYVGENQELIVPNSVKTIGNGAFRSFNGSKLILGKNLEDVRRSAFYSYNGDELTLPASIRRIRQEAFYSYTGVININMSEEKFNNEVIADEGWKNENAILNFLQ